RPRGWPSPARCSSVPARATTRSPPARSRPCWRVPTAAQTPDPPSAPASAGTVLSAESNLMKPTLARVSLPLLLAAGVLATTACTDREAHRRAQAAAEATAREAAAARLQREHEAARAAGNWEMARIHGVALLDQYPDSQAAAAVGPGL